MEQIEIKTLIDVTNTQVQRPTQGTQFEQDQNRNFITLLQCLEIRSIVSYNSKPTCELVDIKGMEFGSNYKGKQMVWTFYVQPDRESVYLDSTGNKVGTLLDDLHEVPVIKKLNETVNIDKAVFDTKDSSFKNTIIKAL
jgi:hypothetical protein